VKTKLTLRVEEELIERAKAWAKSRDMTLSDAVAQFFQILRYEDVEPKLSPWTRRLVGAARRPGDTSPPPTDEEIKNDYVDYLEKKYR
jgi:hypothetical protein